MDSAPAVMLALGALLLGALAVSRLFDRMGARGLGALLAAGFTVGAAARSLVDPDVLAGLLGVERVLAWVALGGVMLHAGAHHLRERPAAASGWTVGRLDRHGRSRALRGAAAFAGVAGAMAISAPLGIVETDALWAWEALAVAAGLSSAAVVGWLRAPLEPESEALEGGERGERRPLPASAGADDGGAPLVRGARTMVMMFACVAGANSDAAALLGYVPVAAVCVGVRAWSASGGRGPGQELFPAACLAWLALAAAGSGLGWAGLLLGAVILSDVIAPWAATLARRVRSLPRRSLRSERVRVDQDAAQGEVEQLAGDGVARALGGAAEDGV